MPKPGMRPRLRRWQVIEGMIKANGWRIGAELGVLRGDTFLHLLSTCPNLALVGVDMWRAMPDKDGEIGGRSYSDVDLEGYYQRLRLRVTTYEVRAVLLRRNTVEAASLFPDRHFDFVFIDADHTYEGVKADIAAWAPKVSKCVMGHDYNERDFPGVIRAVHEAFGQPELHACNIWSVRC